MKKPVILITKPESLGELSALQKAHVKGYTRKDGTFVKEHDTSVTAKPKAEGFGRGDKVKVHKPGQISHGVEGTVIGPSKVKQDHVSIKTLDGKLVSHHKDDLVPAVARPEKSASDDYSAQERRHINRKAKEMKVYHKHDAKSLKSNLGSALSSGDTEMDNGKPMTYGHLKAHLQTMRSQLGNDPAHKDHLEHAQYALNQSFGDDAAQLSDKHAKLIGAALSGKTKMDDNGMIRHRAG